MHLWIWGCGKKGHLFLLELFSFLLLSFTLEERHPIIRLIESCSWFRRLQFVVPTVHFFQCCTSKQFSQPVTHPVLWFMTFNLDFHSVQQCRSRLIPKQSGYLPEFNGAELVIEGRTGTWASKGGYPTETHPAVIGRGRTFTAKVAGRELRNSGPMSFRTSVSWCPGTRKSGVPDPSERGVPKRTNYRRRRILESQSESLEPNRIAVQGLAFLSRVLTFRWYCTNSNCSFAPEGARSYKT